MSPLLPQAIVGQGFWRATGLLRRGGVAVLVYHRVGRSGDQASRMPVDLFGQQMRWLRTNCTVIHPDQFESRVVEPSRRGQVEVLVTFDDGYRDFHELAYPILRELGIVAVNFLSTRHIDEPIPYWWDMLEAAASMATRREAPHPDSPNRPVSLDADGRACYVRAWKRVLKRIADPDGSPLLTEALAGLGVRRAEVSVPRLVMTWDEVRASSKGTIFGGHGHRHTPLPLLTAAALRATVETCRDRIAIETQIRPRLFAYPNGTSCPVSRAAVAHAGFDVSFGDGNGFVNRPVDWMNVGRIAAPRSLPRLTWLLSGWGQTFALRHVAASHGG